MIGNHTLTGGEAKLLRFKFDKSWIFKYLGQFLREETICTKGFLVPLLSRYSATKKQSYFPWMDFESDKRPGTGGRWLPEDSWCRSPWWRRPFFPCVGPWIQQISFNYSWREPWWLVVVTGQTDSQGTISSADIYLFIFISVKTKHQPNSLDNK